MDSSIGFAPKDLGSKSSNGCLFREKQKSYDLDYDVDGKLGGCAGG
jgi:hypothetical protein